MILATFPGTFTTTDNSAVALPKHGLPQRWQETQGRLLPKSKGTSKENACYLAMGCLYGAAKSGRELLPVGNKGAKAPYLSRRTTLSTTLRSQKSKDFSNYRYFEHP
jgi:hypothetical protein